MPIEGVSGGDQNYSNQIEKPNGSVYFTGIDGPEIVRPGEDTSEKDMFLKLMIEQMRQQDPLNPMDSTEMMAQLAQLNTVQQMITLNDSFNKFMTNQDLIQANSLMGRWVEGLDAKLQHIGGKVDWIEVIDGVVTLHLGDQLLMLYQVISVRDDAPVDGSEIPDEGTDEVGGDGSSGQGAETGGTEAGGETGEAA